MIDGGSGLNGDAASSNAYAAGGGGVGWIRVNSACPKIGPNAIISPSLSPASTCATVGPLP